MGHIVSGRRGAAALMASIAMSALLVSTPAFAADPASAAPSGDATAPADASGGEIVVTGTRRADTSVKNTPLAISAFSGELLERNHVISLSDLRMLDPSINIQSYGAGQTKIVLRGIDSNVGATSALYLDENAILGGIGGNILGDGKPGIRLHDVDHVEVLKGPQGTLFGTSSMSGTLRVITRKPELDTWSFSGDLAGAAVDHGNPLGEANATVNAPIVTDKVAVRITAWGEIGGGFINQLSNGTRYTAKDNDQYVRGVRGELLVKLTSDFSLLAQATHQQINVDGTQAFQLTNKDYLNTSPTTEVYRDNYNLYSLTADYDVGVGSIIANGSYSDQKVVGTKDSTPTNHSFGVNADLSFVPDVWFKDYNGEVRFSSKFGGPFQLVAGGYYEHSDSLYQTNAIQAPNGLPVCFSFAECRPYVAAGRGKSVYEFGTNTHRVIDQYAGYAQGDLRILDTLTATVGIRYFKADIHDVVTNLQTVFPDFVFGNVTTPSVTGNTKGSNHKPSYNGALLWKATPDISVYVRAASGFRVGGVNTATSLAAAAGVTFPATYGPDSLWSYEAGIKGYLLNRAIFFDLTGYHVDWKNEQLSASAAGAFAYTINAGKTTSNGVEFNTTVKPTKGLSFTGNVTYVDSKLAENLPASVIAAGTIGYKGDRIPLTPRWSAAGSAEYEVPFSASLNGFVQGNFTYHGDSYSNFNAANQFDTYLPSYTLVGAQMGVRAKHWSAALYGENLGNAVPYLGVVPSIDGTRIFTARPRTIGVRLHAEF
jgi:outer membrane receptor protein involved in Fe transport